MSEIPSRYDSRPFGGDYDPADEPKMLDNMAKVKAFMITNIGQWFTKEEIRIGAGLPVGTDPTPRVRDMRKKPHGRWKVEKRRDDDGLYHYRLMVPDSEIV